MRVVHWNNSMFNIAVILQSVVCTSKEFLWQDSYPGFRWSNNCDFVGNNIGSRAAIDSEECGRICQFESPGCTHFSWAPFQVEIHSSNLYSKTASCLSVMFLERNVLDEIRFRVRAYGN